MAQDVAGGRPPGPDTLPVIGNTLQLAGDPLGLPRQWSREYGDVVYLRFRRQPTFLVTHPDHVEHVLTNHNDIYRKGDFFQTELGLLGDGLLTSEGDLWRRQRRLVGPIFHPERITTYADTMVSFADRMASSWETGEPVHIEEEMMQLTFEIATDVLFNVDVRNEAPGVHEAVSTVMDNFGTSRRIPVSLPRWIPTPRHIRYHRAVSEFDAVVEEIIEDHRRQDDPPDDVVSKLLAATTDEGQGMDDSQVRDEVLTLMLAGHETTSLALSYTWYLLGTHPEVEAKLVEEIDTVLGGRPPTVDDLPDLPYTERIVKEALRLYPPVYFLVREPMQDDRIGGYTVPEGSLIMMYQWVVQRDERFFDDPDRFVPERWTDGFEEELPEFAYFPFGGGPRRCIGERFGMMEARLVVPTIAQRYSLELDFDPPLDLDPLVSLRPGQPIRMVPRER